MSIHTKMLMITQYFNVSSLMIQSRVYPMKLYFHVCMNQQEMICNKFKTTFMKHFSRQWCKWVNFSLQFKTNDTEESSSISTWLSRIRRLVTATSKLILGMLTKLKKGTDKLLRSKHVMLKGVLTRFYQHKNFWEWYRPCIIIRDSIQNAFS